MLDTRDQSSGNGVVALKNVLNGFEVRKVLQEAVDASRRENGMSAREFLGGPGGPAGPGRLAYICCTYNVYTQAAFICFDVWLE